MTTIAGIDIGSNAMRIAIGEAASSGRVKVLYTCREAVRLGGDVFDKGTISNTLIERATGAFWNFRELCDEYGVVFIRAVGTSALRDAKNSEQFVGEISQQTGIRVEVISGAKESQLVQLAVSSKVELKRKLALLIDIGGGSTEVSLLLNGKSIFSESHNVGAVRLLQLVSKRKQPYKLLTRIVGTYIRGMKKSLRRRIGKRSISVCIGTGGNFEALAYLRKTLLGKSGNRRVALRDVDKIIAHLVSLTEKERISQLKLRPDRADVIVPAAITISQIMHAAGVHEVMVPHVGLRDGLLIETASHMTAKRNEIVRAEALTCAQSIGTKFLFDKRHAETVVRYSLMLFDRMMRLHGLRNEDRLLLEVGALLHDVGQFMGEPEHHHHSLYIIKSASWTGLDKRQVAMVACIARYHRRGLPKNEHELFKTLNPSEKKRVRKLASILRIADALDRGRGARIRQVGVKITPGKVSLKLPRRPDSELVRWAVEKKGDLFRKIFNRDLEIQ